MKKTLCDGCDRELDSYHKQELIGKLRGHTGLAVILSWRVQTSKGYGNDIEVCRECAIRIMAPGKKVTK